MNILYPLFSSSAAKMYQITAEVETIINILENIKHPWLVSIIANIEDWKTRLATIMIDILPSTVANEIYTKIDSTIEKIKNKEHAIHTLDDISNTLIIYINKYVKKFLIKNKLLKDNIVNTKLMEDNTV